jgi:hypothetical protein
VVVEPAAVAGGAVVDFDAVVVFDCEFGAVARTFECHMSEVLLIGIRESG